MNEAIDKTILLVDGSNLAFRMYFALERLGLSAPDGRPSWAIHGFLKALFDVIEKYKPTTIVAAFDTKEPTFRHEAYEEYKANRPDEMPEALALQWPEIKRGLQLTGMSIIELPGYEADDIIGTLSLQARNSGWKALILSGDKDNLQLVDDRVKVLMPSPKGMNIMGPDEVYVKMGVLPEKVVDFKALSGDSSDNIVGVPGIGDKTAAKLLNEFEDLEDIYENIEKISSKSLQKKLFEGKDSAYTSRFLAQIKTDCPIAFEFEKLAHELEPDVKGLAHFLNDYRLVSLEKQLPKIFKCLGVTFNAQNHIEQIGLFNKEPDAPKSQDDTKPEVTSRKLRIERRTILSENDFQEALNRMNHSPHLSLDLETDGLNTFECNIVGWAFSWIDDIDSQVKDDVFDRIFQSVYVPTGHSYLGVPTQLDNQFVAKEINNFLQNYTGTLIAQNIKFEYKILKRYGLQIPQGSLDTMLASYLENPDQSHGLKKQSQRVFNYQMAEIEELIGPKGKKQKTMDQVQIEKVSPYACDDAALTLALTIYYFNNLPNKIKDLWINLESPLALILSEMELRGVYVNSDKLLTLSEELAEQIDKEEKIILEKLGSGAFNLNSSQQLAQALINKGFQLNRTETGQYSTDAKALYALIDKDESGAIEKIIEYRVLTKMRSTYTDSLLKQINSKTHRVHGEFNQALTSTGRLSSSNPNLQNIPIKNQKYGQLIRQSFEGQNGKALISADYSQVELRILAHFTEDPTLVDAFTKEQDIHLRTAAEIFEVAPDKVTSDMRRMGKTLNFALLYQQGPYATAKQLGISNKEANEFIDKYFASFPTIKPFMESTLNKARKDGYVETLWGRRRYFKNLHSKSQILRKADERAAFNAPLQGTAADLMKKAMLLVEKRINQDNLDAAVVLQVHDEIVLETKKEQIDKVSEILKEEMVIGQPFKVPLRIDIATGNNWAECK
ncbi:MAG: DNA polymerase I [Candidatus Caenarcaniphilales bacterium]|nr:DNA polymerase I [Candidatus Caenarcaniphilales bacterium]